MKWYLYGWMNRIGHDDVLGIGFFCISTSDTSTEEDIFHKEAKAESL
jgi:hypothetical protein